jgi:hypothetical protein
MRLSSLLPRRNAFEILSLVPEHTRCSVIRSQGAGFDPRLANWAEVGKGAYFSQHVMYGYAYKYKLWDGGTQPAVGDTMFVFVALVSLGNVADLGPGCETCPSPAWNSWKKEFEYMKSPQNPSPKPTRPPLMILPNDPALQCHVTQMLQACICCCAAHA